MKEQLITFETAKLAKERGFNIPSHSYYFEDGEFKEFEINDTYGYYGVEYTVNRTEFYNNWNDKMKTTKQGDKCFGCDNNPKYLETFSAPIQSLLQKWLREVHNIHINGEVRWNNFNKKELIYEFWIKDMREVKPSTRVHTEPSILSYEEALEKGLQEALKLI